MQHNYRRVEAGNRQRLATEEQLIQGTAMAPLLQRQAQGLAQQEGIMTPGVTSLVPPEGGPDVQGPPSLKMEDISARPAPLIQSMIGKRLDSLLRRQEQETMESQREKRDLFNNLLGATTTAQAEAAQSLYNQKSAIDPADPDLALLKAYLVPGVGRQTEWAAVVPRMQEKNRQAEAKMRELKAVGDQRMEYGKAMADSRSRTALEV